MCRILSCHLPDNYYFEEASRVPVVAARSKPHYWVSDSRGLAVNTGDMSAQSQTDETLL
jgi:hypothetical protein